MNENIDLTKILKNCPVGWKFYSYVFGEETYFKGLSPYQGSPLPISIYGKYEGFRFHLSSKGHPHNDSYGECCIFPSKDQRDWSKFSAPWYKKERFDPNTIKPFDKVLVFTNGEWTCDFFSHTLSGDIFNKRCMGIGDVNVVIPYNDETKHLVGTTEEAPDYYRYWDD